MKFSYEPADRYNGDRSAIVLGARPGTNNIGDAIALALAEQGWPVTADDCLIGDGSRPPGGNIPDGETAAAHGYVETDKGWYARYDAPPVADFQDADADALVITLGSTYKEPFWDVREYDIERVIRSCLTLPLLCARRYVEATRMSDREIELNRGEPRHIVFVGSYAHNHPFTNGTVYCAAKAGLDMAARTLGWELTDRGYRVHIVHPWHVKGTPMWQEVEQGVMKSKGWTKEEADAYADRDLKMPEGLTPEDVAAVVRLLLTEPVTGWMSGTAIELTGGTR